MKFSAIASSNEIGRTDYVQVEFVVENAHEIERLTEPSFRDFHVVQGPIQSSGMSVVNGAISQYKSISYVLQPLRMGRFTIPGASAVVDGRAMRSNPLVITVNSAPSAGTHTLPMPQAAWPGEAETFDPDYLVRPGDNLDDKVRKNLFLKVQVSKTSCYVGEPIVATYKLYSHLRTESRVTKHPSLNGFSVYDMIDPTNQMGTIERLNGKVFSVHIIRKAQLIPLQAGQVDLDPLEVENTVHFLKVEAGAKSSGGNSIRDMFDSFFQGQENGIPVEKDVELETKPVTITVKDLPEANKPADFNGAVGRFSISSSIETKKISEQDGAILEVTVRGEGNLPVVNAPQIAWPAGIESYDPSAKEEVDKTVAPLKGYKTFQYSFIPKHAGRYDIPAVSLSYFDPADAIYKTVKAQDLAFSADPAPPQKSKTLLARVMPNNGQAPSFFMRNLEWVAAFLVLFLALFLALQNWRLKRKRTQARPTQRMQAELQPEVVTVDPLLRARRMLETSDPKGFYEELNLALWKAMEDKLQLPGSQMNKQVVLMRLRDIGWDQNSIGQLAYTLQECEMKLYTPAYNPADMEKILANAQDILQRLA